MSEFLIFLALVLLGACFGSFAGASVWRLRARQLAYDKQHKEPYDKNEYARLKKLLGKKVSSDRSQCLHCGYTLRWYDLVPVVSWLSLKGKCRNCRTPIGKFELAIELGMIAFFVGSYMLWPEGLTDTFEWARLGVWLAAGVVLAILTAYDLKWFLLPNSMTLLLALLGAAMVALTLLSGAEVSTTLVSAAGAIAAISGLYAVLYYLSGKRWVGFGDVKLGVGLGLLLIDWRLALLAVFLANLIGCLVIIPLLLTRKMTRKDMVPFGPMLILGTILAFFFGYPMIDWYLGLLSF